MGFAFILIVFLALFDLGMIIAAVARALGAKRVGERLKLRLLRVVVVAAVVCTCYGFCEALMIRTEHLTIHSPKIPPGTDRIRIVQISDVHVGVMIGKWRLKRMLEPVLAARPDILLATGDMVDGQIHRRNGLVELFRGVTPRYGSFLVLGNHEFYAGLENSLAFLKDSGFRILRKETIPVLPYLLLAGVDDSAAQRWGDAGSSDEHGLLPAQGNAAYTILMKHRPAIAPESRGKFDLQLSGHVHKGQIFPFNFLTYLSFPVCSGENRLADGSMLYVSRGTGTWGPPIRFLAPPEVTVIDLVPALP
ncbi:putative metallophosphoesterase aq_1054 [Geobacter sp. OR-1]|uniref:metallophosphoesterase n=1 Tax=Geobacter sp. OR-1 TaxID=1266765 RepID=UPI0005425D1A|nr:metallophosphoesterase [Geobacter sp. OR-1]GAM08064.1 putative metallophosphoesterase aq_1054 [Geobacter sp. OR-1]